MMLMILESILLAEILVLVGLGVRLGGRYVGRLVRRSRTRRMVRERQEREREERTLTPDILERRRIVRYHHPTA